MFLINLPTKESHKILVFMESQKIKFLMDGNDHETIFVNTWSDYEKVSLFISNIKEKNEE